jgi:hypothetical protein
MRKALGRGRGQALPLVADILFEAFVFIFIRKQCVISFIYNRMNIGGKNNAGN